MEGQVKLCQQLFARLKSYFPLVLELFGKEWQLTLLLDIVGRWPDPRQLRRADRRLIRTVLRENSIRNEQQQDQIIDRICSAPLLCDDEALITPSAMGHQRPDRGLGKQRVTHQRNAPRMTAVLTRLGGLILQIPMSGSGKGAWVTSTYVRWLKVRCH